MAATGSRGRQFVQALERGLDVIRALSLPGSGRTLSDVARDAAIRRELLPPLREAAAAIEGDLAAGRVP